MNVGIFGLVAEVDLVWVQLALVAALVATAAYLIHARCRTMIAAWAGHGGWEVVRIRRCVLNAGPFTLVPGLPVYRVEVASRSGRARQAYVRCGNLIASVLADEIAIEWADAAAR